MSAFTGPLALLELATEVDEMRILDSLPWEVGSIGSRVFITVPPNFISDGGTIPWPFSILLPKWGRVRRAFVLHDFMCRCLADGTPHPCAPTRKDADRIFREAALACLAHRSALTSRPYVAILYLGVRIGALLGIGSPRD